MRGQAKEKLIDLDEDVIDLDDDNQDTPTPTFSEWVSEPINI